MEAGQSFYVGAGILTQDLMPAEQVPLPTEPSSLPQDLNSLRLLMTIRKIASQKDFY